MPFWIWLPCGKSVWPLLFGMASYTIKWATRSLQDSLILKWTIIISTNASECNCFLPLDLLWLEEKQKTLKSFGIKTRTCFIFAIYYGLWPFWGFGALTRNFIERYSTSCWQPVICPFGSAGFWLRLNSNSKKWTENRLSDLLILNSPIILFKFLAEISKLTFDPDLGSVQDCFWIFVLAYLIRLFFLWVKNSPS